jgi:hypothetical protein
MQAVASKSPETGVKPGLRGFLDLCEQVGFEPEAFQRKIASAALRPERELVVLLPRGNGKISLQLQALSTDDVYVALSSDFHKRPDSKLIVASIAGQGAESPLGKLRRRALGLPQVKRRGFLTEAKGPDLHMLEWATGDEGSIGPAEVKKANPASWITTDQIRAAKRALPELARLIHRRSRRPAVPNSSRFGLYSRDALVPSKMATTIAAET